MPVLVQSVICACVQQVHMTDCTLAQGVDTDMEASYRLSVVKHHMNIHAQLKLTDTVRASFKVSECCIGSCNSSEACYMPAGDRRRLAIIPSKGWHAPTLPCVSKL